MLQFGSLWLRRISIELGDLDPPSNDPVAELNSRVTFPAVKFFARTFFALAFLPLCAFASNSVVNLSHYDLVRVDFVAMKSEGVVGVIHEATFPRLQRDWRYFERQASA